MLNYLKQHRAKLVYFPLALYWGALLIGTSLPGSKAPNITVNDKIQHLAAFAGLGVLLSMTLFVQEKYKLLNRHFMLSSLAIITIYAALDEIHQIFIPGRSADPFDLLSDFLGAVIGGSLFILFKNKFLQ